MSEALRGAGRFEGHVHLLPVLIYYEDTDFSGMVYHANYLRYFERGRSDYLRLAGFSHAELLQEAEPLAFTIQRIEVDFRLPARIDDALVVRTVYSEMRGARLTARQDIHRGSDLIARAEVHAACISMEGRPRRLPADMQDALRSRLVEVLPSI